MKRPSFIAGAAAISAVAALVLAAPADATGSKYDFLASAGGTQVNAVGVTVESSATATSTVVGQTSQTANSSLASANAGSVLNAGAVTTDASSVVNSNGGVTLTAHARTAAISLLGGLIKADAVETTATVAADGTNTPTASMTTQLLGLTIAGKSYPTNFAPNSGLTIPGVVTIGFNAQLTSVDAAKNTAAVIGAGLKVTLLEPLDGTTAGASVLVNPVVEFLSPTAADLPGYAISGAGFGTYVSAHVGDTVQVKSSPTALMFMPAQGTDGATQTASTASAVLPNVLNVGAVQTNQSGLRSAALSQVSESSSVANVNLLGGLIKATAIGSTSTASATSTKATASGSVNLVNLVIAGQAIPINVAPNTKIHLANIGTVTINEQTPTTQAGFVHSYRTTAIHIVLDTATAGLPVGAEIIVASTEATVWD